jgi:hypothetical protein
VIEMQNYMMLEYHESSVWMYLIVISLLFKILVTYACTQLQINIIILLLRNNMPRNIGSNHDQIFIIYS